MLYCRTFLVVSFLLASSRFFAGRADEPVLSGVTMPTVASTAIPVAGESATAMLRPTMPSLQPRLPRLIVPPNSFGQTPNNIGAWLRQVIEAYPQRALGKSSQGRVIYALEIAPEGKSPWQVKRLAVICRQHGNEPEATASGTRMVYEFLTSSDPLKKQLAARTALLIVPICNPDGAAVYRRRTAQNIDMNRDWIRERSPEVRALHRWLASWKPHLLIDNHEWLPFERMPPPMADAAGGWVARRAALLMSRKNAQRGYYLSARSERGSDTLAHRYWGQHAKVPSVLLETRHRPSVPGARQVAITQAVTAIWAAAQSLNR